MFQKLLEVKKQVQYLKKNSKSFNYAYANGTAVLGAINPILNENGVLLKPEVVGHTREEVEIVTKTKTKMEHLYEIDMTMTWIDCDNGDMLTSLWFASGVNGVEKGYGSALTYAERYFMLKFFQIPTDELDPDFYEKKYERKPAVKKTVSKTTPPVEDKPSPDFSETPKQVPVAITKEDYKKLYNDNKKLFPPKLAEQMLFKSDWEGDMLPAIYDRLKAKISEFNNQKSK